MKLKYSTVSCAEDGTYNNKNNIGVSTYPSTLFVFDIMKLYEFISCPIGSIRAITFNCMCLRVYTTETPPIANNKAGNVLN